MTIDAGRPTINTVSRAPPLFDVTHSHPAQFSLTSLHSHSLALFCLLISHLFQRADPLSTRLSFTPHCDIYYCPKRLRLCLTDLVPRCDF